MLRALQPLGLPALAMLGAGVLLGVGSHWARTGQLAAHPPPEALACADEAGEPEPVALLDPLEVASLCEDPSVLVLDVRSADQFAAGHVAGAVHLPCSAGALGPEVTGRLGSTVVIYGDDTAEAVPVARSLARRGASDVRVIGGGYPAWERAGLACSSGPCEGCAHGHLVRGDDS